MRVGSHDVDGTGPDHGLGGTLNCLAEADLISAIGIDAIEVVRRQDDGANAVCLGAIRAILVDWATLREPSSIPGSMWQCRSVSISQG